MADEYNNIPAVFAAGSFEAIAPFDTVVKPNVYYTVEAVRTIKEMQALKLNMYDLIFKPVGVKEEDYQTILNRAISINAVVVCLTAHNKDRVYVLSDYLKSFPLVDGVSYERMCLIVDLGACPPSLKDELSSTQNYIQQYVKATMGIDSTVNLGTVPTVGYVSYEQYQTNETTRKNAITNTSNYVADNNAYKQQIIDKDNYIAYLESQLEALQPQP